MRACLMRTRRLKDCKVAHCGPCGSGNIPIAACRLSTAVCFQVLNRHMLLPASRLMVLAGLGAAKGLL